MRVSGWCSWGIKAGDVPAESRGLAVGLSTGPAGGGCSGKVSGLAMQQLCLLGGEHWHWEQQKWLRVMGLGWDRDSQGPSLLQDTRRSRAGHTGPELCPLQLGKPFGNATGGVFQGEADRSPGRNQAVLFN